ncbi:lytic transglycosylase domain-containing protein [Marinospirillum alkaliphilum]|uniref:Soluble lytic murein transglycosylase n=1 Tax=Marinospirillum alkaliphilum DSM 21637 TaxID=1122209 RepID=A0A1K1YZE8_9GAMM|nr:lytic transglycosylase domain-containing protein [Marinospirillum alkaliphilum]SFX67289.1 soluble lytic murein transglycosylase [Marinospirillum alkaliphilum DSM 21637]
MPILLKALQYLRQHLKRLHLAGLLSGLLCVLLLFPASSSTSAFFGRQYLPLQPDPQARLLFTQTYRELRRGQLVDLAEVLPNLQHYPLAPYLEYQLFRNQLAYRVVDQDRIHSFLTRHADAGFHARLRDEWLTNLGQQQNWDSYLQATSTHGLSNNLNLQCFQLRAEAAIQGQSMQWLEQAADFWRNNQPLPASCRPLSESLHLLGLLSSEDYANAALALMRNRQTSQAWALNQHLTPQDRQWLTFWRNARQNPSAQINALLQGRVNLKSVDASLRDELLTDLLQHHGRTHPTQTRQFVTQLTQHELISQQAGWSVLEHLAIRAAQRSQDATLELFARIPTEARSFTGHEWYARTLLRQAQWPELLDALQWLNAEQLSTGEWRYWQAHALQQTGETAEARQRLQALATERQYYGFLAARELGLPLSMNAADTPIQAHHLQELSQHPGLIRAAELYFTGFTEDATREWLHSLRDATPEDWIQAGWLARHWGWHDRSVDAANRAGMMDALELRFPLAHLETLQPLAQQANLELSLILALIRKESLFNPDARSPVGALGLMQVMPATGQQVSRQLRINLQPESDLLKPEYNLPVGVHYLAGLMRRYQQDPILAAAAYNAGPTRANSWRNSFGQETDPLWVERITFAETRDYVKSLIAFSEVYAWRLAQEAQRQALLNPLPPGPEG